MDSISSSLLDEFYKDDAELKRRRRITAIVGASYLLHLRATRPEKLSAAEQALLDQLLQELEVPPELAMDLLREIEEKGTRELLAMFGK